MCLFGSCRLASLCRLEDGIQSCWFVIGRWRDVVVSGGWFEGCVCVWRVFGSDVGRVGG